MMDMSDIPEFLQGEELETVKGVGDDYVEREAASDIVESTEASFDEDDENIVT